MWTKWKKTLLAVALHLLGLRHHLLLLHLIVHQVFYMDASYAKLFGDELAEVFSFQLQPPILQYSTPECTPQRYYAKFMTKLVAISTRLDSSHIISWHFSLSSLSHTGKRKIWHDLWSACVHLCHLFVFEFVFVFILVLVILTSKEGTIWHDLWAGLFCRTGKIDVVISLGAENETIQCQRNKAFAMITNDPYDQDDQFGDDADLNQPGAWQ